MRYEVPQFSEVQTKIVGPFSIKQFAYLLVGGGIFYILFKALNLFWAFLFGLPILALAGALAFLKINGQPFAKVLTNGLQFVLKPKFYIWKKDLPKIKPIKYDKDEE